MQQILGAFWMHSKNHAMPQRVPGACGFVLVGNSEVIR